MKFGLTPNFLVVGKYILFQIPGWVAAIGLAWWASSSLGLEKFWAIVAVVLWIVKDAVLYPFVRAAYSMKPGEGGAPKKGAIATATENLNPEGYVRVNAELWRARISTGTRVIKPGETVEVQKVDGLTLIVSATDPE